MLRVDPIGRIQMKFIFLHPWIEEYTKKMNPLMRGSLESLNSSLGSFHSSLEELHDESPNMKFKNEFGVIDEEDDTENFKEELVINDDNSPDRNVQKKSFVDIHKTLKD